jgi:hypothetical protein
MKRLTTDLMDAFTNRMTAAHEAQHNTQNQIRANQMARSANASDQQQHLHQQMDNLHQQVSEMRTAAQQRMHDINAAHTEMANNQHAHSMQRKRELRQNIADYMGRTNAARMAMSQQQREHLDDFTSRLRQTNERFVSDTKATRMQMSDQVQHDLHDFMVTLQANIGQMRTNTGEFMQSVNTVRAEMGAAQHELLSNTKAQLTADITVMCNGIQVAQAAMRADQAAARSEWMRFDRATAESRVQAMPPTEAPAPAATPEPPTPPTPPAETAPDGFANEKKKMT